MKFQVGNIIKTPHNSVNSMTEFKKYEWPYERYRTNLEFDYVLYNCGPMCNGSLSIEGKYETEMCGCWYDKFARCYSSERPDTFCEDCKGTGEVQEYRYGLNDCTFISASRRDYEILKTKAKIEKLQEKLKNLEKVP